MGREGEERRGKYLGHVLISSAISCVCVALLVTGAHKWWSHVLTRHSLHNNTSVYLYFHCMFKYHLKRILNFLDNQFLLQVTTTKTTLPYYY